MKETFQKLIKKWWFWVIAALAFLTIISMFVPRNNTEIQNSTVSSESTNNSKENNSSKANNEEKVVFLEGTNFDTFAETLSKATGISKISKTESGGSVTWYTSSDKYGISIDADKKTRKIGYIRIICMGNTTNNEALKCFLTLTQLNYSTENDSEFTNWLTDNIGKNAKTKIGDANIELMQSTSNLPIIELKTDGYDDYCLEQIDELLGN